MKKISISLLVMLGISQLVKAQQDAQLSQQIFNGIYINPAYAGYKEQLNIQGFYRDQWTGIPGAPKTEALTIDAIANDNKVGLAFQISGDHYGAQSNLSAYANYAYRLQMNLDGSARLAFGLGVGFVQLGIDGSKLHPDDPEPYQPVGFQSKIAPDARIGAYYSDNDFFAGFSVDNLVDQFFKVGNYSFVPQPKPHFYLTAGMVAPLAEKILLRPSLLLKDDRAGPMSVEPTVFFIWDQNLWIGCSYRTTVKLYNKTYLQQGLSQGNAIVAAIQVWSVKNFRIGYSYDISVGALQGYTGGTHEIVLGYFFPEKRKEAPSPKYF